MPSRSGRTRKHRRSSPGPSAARVKASGRSPLKGSPTPSDRTPRRENRRPTRESRRRPRKRKRCRAAARPIGGGSCDRPRTEAKRQARVAFEQRGIAEAQTREAEIATGAKRSRRSRAPKRRVPRPNSKLAPSRKDAGRPGARRVRAAGPPGPRTGARRQGRRTMGQPANGNSQRSSHDRPFSSPKTMAAIPTMPRFIRRCGRRSIYWRPTTTELSRSRRRGSRDPTHTVDGARLVTGSDDGKVRLFDMGGVARRGELLGDAGSPGSIARPRLNRQPARRGRPRRIHPPLGPPPPKCAAGARSRGTPPR